MSAPHHGPEFEDREVAVIKRVVYAHIARSAWHTRDDFQDLFQEVALKWTEARNTFRENGGANRLTYLARVARNHLADIRNKTRSLRRGGRHTTVSLNAGAGGGDEEPLAPTLSKDLGEGLEAVHRKLDLAPALEALTDRQRLIAACLREEVSYDDIAARLGIGKSTVGDEVRRIRQVFRDHGLAPQAEP